MSSKCRCYLSENGGVNGYFLFSVLHVRSVFKRFGSGVDVLTHICLQLYRRTLMSWRIFQPRTDYRSLDLKSSRGWKGLAHAHRVTRISQTHLLHRIPLVTKGRPSGLQTTPDSSSTCVLVVVGVTGGWSVDHLWVRVQRFFEGTICRKGARQCQVRPPYFVQTHWGGPLRVTFERGPKEVWNGIRGKGNRLKRFTGKWHYSVWCSYRSTTQNTQEDRLTTWIPTRTSRTE